MRYIFIKSARNTLILLLLSFIIILITLMPRDIEYLVEGKKVTDIQHTFSWKEYRDNVIDYIKYIAENKSLGVNKSGDPIEEELFRLTGRSIKLIIPAFILSLFLGITKGIFDFRNRNKRRGIFGKGATSFFQAIPDFFIIIAFQYSVLLLIRKGFPKLPLYGFSEWYHLILPIAFITLFTMTYVARLTCLLLEEQEGNEYIRTAISKGVSQKGIVYKHMLKNILNNLFDYFPTIMLVLLTHLVIVEHLMYYRGITVGFFDSFVYKTVFSIGTQFPIKFPMIIGSILFVTAILLVIEWFRFIGKLLVNPFIKGEMS